VGSFALSDRPTDHNSSVSEVVVIGAGAAGIIAAWRAAILGAKVTLVEKTPRIGTKILISGGGKCNITHDGPLEDLLRAFRPAEARFIRPACYRFQNHQIVEMLTSRGLQVYTRPDGRIFPVDQTAKDVVRILRSYLDEAGVEVLLDTPVTGLQVEDNKIIGVVGPERIHPCDSAIVAVGGSSYPNSGTTGDGWKWCRELGHTIVKPTAALAPIYLNVDENQATRSGVALRDCILKGRTREEVARWRGDLLFTHHGISGPTALGISRIIAERMRDGEVTLEVDLLPDLREEDLTTRLLAYAAEHPRRLIASFVDEVVPERLVEDILAAASIDRAVPFSRLDKKSRNRLVSTLKRWPLGPVRTVPLEKGEVVAGGVSLDEVDPKTLQSKLVKGLYLCGEVLDIAGPVGGYNLQAAFATGYVAGESAATAVGLPTP
jgi:predicted Rossmann fold flavoprotein